MPVSVRFATTPLDVARKLVIFAVSESLDEVGLVSGEPALALAGSASRPARTRAEKPRPHLHEPTTTSPVRGRWRQPERAP